MNQICRTSGGGLSQGTAVPSPAPATATTDPLWARMVSAFATPFTQAISSRIAYGKTYPTYGGGAFQYTTPGSYYQGSGYINPSTIALLGGGALLVLLLMRK